MLSETSPNVESPVPMKKPKLDEEETSRANPGSGYSSDDNDGFEHFENKEQIEAYRKYERQLTESGGFDIDVNPPMLRSQIGSHVLRCDLSNKEEFDLIKRFTNFAIDRYNQLNKGKSQLKLVEIEKANRAWGSRGDCYITFQALDTKSKETDTYQTEIDFSFLGDKIDVFLFRKKGQKKGRETGILFPADLSDYNEYIKIKKCVEAAISSYNEDWEGERQFQLVKIKKAAQDMQNCPLWYMAVEARDTISGRTETCYAATRYVSDEKIELHLFTPKDEECEDEYDGLEEVDEVQP